MFIVSYSGGSTSIVWWDHMIYLPHYSRLFNWHWSNPEGYWATAVLLVSGQFTGRLASLSYVLYGCVANLHICPRISKDVAHLTAKKAYFVLSAMVVTDSPGTRQTIVTALQGDRNCHIWIVTDWICQDWSNGNYWIRAKSLPPQPSANSIDCMVTWLADSPLWQIVRLITMTYSFIFFQ